MVDISKIDSVDVLKKSFENLKVAKEEIAKILSKKVTAASWKALYENYIVAKPEITDINMIDSIEKLKNAEMNKEIEDGYNIVKLDGKYLIVKDSDVDQAVELAGVTDAHVIPTNDQDRNQNYNVLVVKKDGEWRVVDETKKGEDVLVLTGETITADTKFRLKDKTLYIE